MKVDQRSFHPSAFILRKARFGRHWTGKGGGLKSETFEFLGLTHIAGKSRPGGQFFAEATPAAPRPRVWERRLAVSRPFWTGASVTAYTAEMAACTVAPQASRPLQLLWSSRQFQGLVVISRQGEGTLVEGVDASQPKGLQEAAVLAARQAFRSASGSHHTSRGVA